METRYYERLDNICTNEFISIFSNLWDKSSQEYVEIHSRWNSEDICVETKRRSSKQSIKINYQ